MLSLFRFRWVALQLDALENCQSEAEIIQQLKSLPKDLNTTYDKMLKAIDSTYLGDTIIFLQWLAFAQRPMKIAEIADVITVDFDTENSPIFNKKKQYINPKSVFARCLGLISETHGMCFYLICYICCC